MPTDTKHSAKTLRQPLLDVLGTLSGMKAGVAVPHGDTYDRVFQIAGITDLKSHGENNGQPLPIRWVQWAFKDLRGLGLTEALGRGMWALTKAGVSSLQSPMPLLEDPPEGATEDASDGEDEDANISCGTPQHSGPVAPPVQGQSIDIGPGRTPDYHLDSYIREIALSPANTPCFGSYLSSDKTCGNCPAMNLCINATSINLVSLARTLAAEDVARIAEEREREERAKAPRQAPHVPVRPTRPTTPPVAPGVDLSDLDLQDGFRKVSIAIPTMCRRCRQTLAKDTDAMWVRRAGSSTRNSVMMHVACFEATKAEAKR